MANMFLFRLGMAINSCIRTPGYMAPETFLRIPGEPSSTKVSVGIVMLQGDIFSLGIILCEMLSGKKLWEVKEGEILPSHSAGEPSISISHFELLRNVTCAEVGGQLRDLLQDLLVLHPSHRLDAGKAAS